MPCTKMIKILFVSYYVLVNIQFVRSQTYTSVISTASGPLRGFISTTIENKKYAAFKGIPYAKPPVGRLRFKRRNKALLSFVASAISTGVEKLTTNAKYILALQLTDLFFVLGIDAKQKLMSRNNDYPIYYYRFSFRPNYSLHQALGVNLQGVAHGDDIPYVFYTPVANLPLDQPDIATTRRRMVKLGTNFAKYGNPTPNGEKDATLGITWPDSRLNGDHLEIDKDLTTGPRPISQLVKSLQSINLGESSLLNGC